MTRILLVNPLPHALQHYASGLSHSLEDNVRTLDSSVERQDGSLAARAWRQLRLRLDRPKEDVVVVLWPALGRWEALSWALSARRHTVWLVVHDPTPLRAQHGHGSLAALSEVLGRRAGVRVVSHSTAAHAVLADQGWRPVPMPYPVVPPSPGRRDRTGPVLVLGQYKPSRSLAVLAQLAKDPELDGQRAICGRGWPRVEGWDREDGFVSEERFDQRLSSARCLVLPYQTYYQSDVAVRALEGCIPVVAARHPFLLDLLGPDWPGFVAGGDWGAAVRRVGDVSPEILGTLAGQAAERARVAWSSALSAR